MGLRTVVVVVILSGAVAPPNMFAHGGVTPYERATALLRQGMVKQAEEVLRTDLRDDPEDDRDLNLLGTILDAQQRFDEAEEVYSRALKIAPNSASLLNNLGNHYAARGQIERARAAYLHVIEFDAHHSNANLHLAQISVAQEHGQDALGYVDNLQEPDRSSPTAQLLRAEALHLTGQQVSSLEVLDQLETKYPKSPSVIFSVGLTLVDWGRYDDAERAFTKALATRPTDTNILYNLGLAATRAGHFDLAEESFQDVLKQRPDDVDALCGLARVYEAEGHDERAVDFLSKAHRLAPRRPEILLMLAKVEEERGHYAESAKQLDECLKLDPNNSAVKREFAFALAHTVEFNRGLAQLASYIETNPQDPVGFYELALAETKERGEKALNHLNQAIVLDPNYLPARFARAVLNDKAGKPADSVSDLTLILERNPNDARALDLLGQAQAAQNQDQEAVASLLRAAQLAPGDAQILMHYSRALLRVDRKEESKAVLAKLEQTGVPYRQVVSLSMQVHLCRRKRPTPSPAWRAKCERTPAISMREHGLQKLNWQVDKPGKPSRALISSWRIPPTSGYLLAAARRFWTTGSTLKQRNFSIKQRCRRAPHLKSDSMLPPHFFTRVVRKRPSPTLIKYLLPSGKGIGISSPPSF